MGFFLSNYDSNKWITLASPRKPGFSLSDLRDKILSGILKQVSLQVQFIDILKYLLWLEWSFGCFPKVRKPLAISPYYGQIQLPLKMPPSAGNPRLPLVPFTATSYLTPLFTLTVPNPAVIAWLWFHCRARWEFSNVDGQRIHHARWYRGCRGGPAALLALSHLPSFHRARRKFTL